MQEILGQIYTYLRGIWRRRWPMLLMAWFICLAGWVYVLTMPDEYSSSAKVYVDTQSVLQPLLRGLAIQSGVAQEVDLMTRTLFSRPNLEKAARMTDLDLNVNNDREMDRLLNSLADRVRLSGGGRQRNIYTLSFYDSDPELAKKVVQSFLTIFVESSLGSNRKDSDVAQKFIDEQIREYEARLVEAEDRLKEFKQKNVGLMPGSGGDYFSQLKAAQSQLILTQERLTEVIKRREEIKNQMSEEDQNIGLSPSANIFSGGLAHPLDGRIAEMEKRLDELLLNYTQRHPDVISTIDTMERLKNQRQSELDQAIEDNPEVANSSPLLQNPVYQQQKISLGQAEAEIASLEVRLEKAKQNVERLEQLVDTVPAVEAEMKRLNRDYSIVKGNYEQLLNRRESAQMAQKAEASGDGVQFKVIEPARIALEPSGPNRPLFLSIVLLAGIGAGVAMAFFLSQLKQTFDTRVSLREALDLPVLGSIAMEWSPAQRLKLRIETAAFLSMGFSLLVIYLIVLLMQERLRGIISQLGVLVV